MEILPLNYPWTTFSQGWGQELTAGIGKGRQLDSEGFCEKFEVQDE